MEGNHIAQMFEEAGNSFKRKLGHEGACIVENIEFIERDADMMAYIGGAGASNMLTGCVESTSVENNWKLTVTGPRNFLSQLSDNELKAYLIDKLSDFLSNNSLEGGLTAGLLAGAVVGSGSYYLTSSALLGCGVGFFTAMVTGGKLISGAPKINCAEMIEQITGDENAYASYRQKEANFCAPLRSSWVERYDKLPQMETLGLY